MPFVPPSPQEILKKEGIDWFPTKVSETTVLVPEKVQRLISEAEDAVKGLKSSFRHTLSDHQIEDLASMSLAFCKKITESALGIQLYDYQEDFAWKIFYDLLSAGGSTITGYWARQLGKCLAEGTEVLMFDGTAKKVEEVEIGDLLMGPDSNPRRVLSLSNGEDDLFTITPISKKHEPYTVNSAHILTVLVQKHTRTGGECRKPVVVDVPLQSVMNHGPEWCQGLKAEVSFPEQPVPVDPYYLGLWLGDGTSSCANSITSGDAEIVDAIYEYAERLGMRVSVGAVRPGSSVYRICSRTKIPPRNPLIRAMRTLALINNKHIPQLYKSNSFSVRARVLAGLIDTDGHHPKQEGSESTCELTLVNRVLAKDTQWLARSLGLRAGITPKMVNGTVYWRIQIYGPLWKIPTRIPRKQYSERKLRDNPLAYGFKVVPAGRGKFFGFRVDGDQRFLLADLTITHNSSGCGGVAGSGLVFLPILAKYTDDTRVQRFKNGLWIGFYAPTGEQAAISYDKMCAIMSSDPAQQIIRDPQVAVPWNERGGGLNRKTGILWLPNGSVALFSGTPKQRKIEGRTWHLIIQDESQDMDQSVIDNNLSPMLSATQGTYVKIGVRGSERSDFMETVRHLSAGDIHIKDKRKRNCHKITYAVGIKRNPWYLNFIKKTIEKHGVDSDFFKRNFSLEGGDSEQAIQTTWLERGAMPDKNETPWDKQQSHVVGIDIGRVHNATFITIGRIDSQGLDFPPDMVGQERRFHKIITRWHRIVNVDDYGVQSQMIMKLLDNYSVSVVVLDATGGGGGLHDFLKPYFAQRSIKVVPFNFSGGNKEALYENYICEWAAGRIHYPAAEKTRRTPEYKAFIEEHLELQRIVGPDGRKVKYHAPPDKVAAHDDACLSMDTEILTERGFLTFDEIRPHDKMGAYDPQTGSITLTTPLRVFSRDLNDNEYMVHIAGPQIDQLVTNNHKCLFHHRSGGWRARVEPAEFLLRFKSRKNAQAFARIKFPAQAENAAAQDHPSSDEEIQMMAWIITEGWRCYDSRQDTYRYMTSQSVKANPQKCETIRSLVRSLGLSCHEHHRKDGVITWQFRAACNEFFDTLLPSGPHRIPRYALNGFSKRQCVLLLDTLILGDGHTRAIGTKTRTYYGSNDDLIDDVHELCFRAGLRSSIHTRFPDHHIMGRVRKQLNPAHTVHIHTNRFATPHSVTRILNTGQRVWCATVPSGFIVIRRNRKISITGNCDSAAMMVWAEKVLYKEMPVIEALNSPGIVKAFGRGPSFGRMRNSLLTGNNLEPIV